MLNKKKSLFRVTTKAVFLLVLYCLQVFAQDDPNPDSPTPVLLSGTDANRVLAIESGKWGGKVPQTGQQAFRVRQKSFITIFVTNLDLLPDGGANAIRIYLKAAALQISNIFLCHHH
jgi:hypothetical protein